MVWYTSHYETPPKTPPQQNLCPVYSFDNNHTIRSSQWKPSFKKSRWNTLPASSWLKNTLYLQYRQKANELIVLQLIQHVISTIQDYNDSRTVFAMHRDAARKRRRRQREPVWKKQRWIRRRGEKVGSEIVVQPSYGGARRGVDL